MKVPNIAVIGLGSMGLGMAASIVRAGFPVRGFDLSPDALSRFAAAGGIPAADVGEAAAGADILVLVVVNAAQTEDVLFGQGAAAALRPGGVIVSSATLAPKHAVDFAARAKALGIEYLDAPISGGSAKAETGGLTVMASGSAAAFKAARPVLSAIAATVYELGDAPGIGASFKIVNQLLAGVHIVAACEAITFAKRMGLDLAKVYEVITASAGNSWMFQDRIRHVLDGDYAPRSAVDIFAKDLGIVAEIGRETKFPTPLAATALQLFIMTSAVGMGRDDDASVARFIAQITGLELPAAGPGES